VPVVPDESPVVERGVLSLSDGAWEEARRRAAVIGRVAAWARCPMTLLMRQVSSSACRAGRCACW